MKASLFLETGQLRRCEVASKALRTAHHLQRPGCTRSRRRRIGDPCRRRPVSLLVPPSQRKCSQRCANRLAALGSGVDELLAEALPVLVGRGLLDDNLLVVVRQLVDDVLELLGELEVIVGSYALRGNGRSGSAATLAPSPTNLCHQSPRSRMSAPSQGGGHEETMSSPLDGKCEEGYEPGLRLDSTVSCGARLWLCRRLTIVAVCVRRRLVGMRGDGLRARQLWVARDEAQMLQLSWSDDQPVQTYRNSECSWAVWQCRGAKQGRLGKVPLGGDGGYPGWRSWAVFRYGGEPGGEKHHIIMVGLAVR